MCTKCQEDFLIGKMKEDAQVGLLRLLEARAPELKELQINWFGGEPFLALALTSRIPTRGCRLADQHGFCFSGGLSANGYMFSLQVLTDLVDLRQYFFQISLEGWQKVHDSTRRRADGAGNFYVIWNNLLKARDIDRGLRTAIKIKGTPGPVEVSIADLARFGHENRWIHAGAAVPAAKPSSRCETAWLHTSPRHNAVRAAARAGRRSTMRCATIP